MAAPTTVKLIEPRREYNRVGLAIATGDGAVQDLDLYESKAIQDGSTLRVCSADWTTVNTVYERINGVWSLIATLN